MKVAVIRPDELGENEFAIWHGFQRATPSLANPFLAPEFTVAVGRLRPRSYVAVLSEGSEIIGFFPFERSPLGSGIPIGGGIADCQGVVHAPGVNWDPHELLRSCGLAVWQFDHLVDGQKPFEPYEVVRAPSPVMDLSDGFDAYYASLHHTSSLRTLRRRERRLTTRSGEPRVAFPCHDHDALRTLMAWKSAQYLRTGLYDQFARTWVVQLLEQLLETATDNFSCVLSALCVGDQTVAVDLFLRNDDVLAAWFSAYDPAYASYSPGLLLHLHGARCAADAGVAHIDMGRGEQDYKEVLRSRDLFVAEGVVARRSPAAALHTTRLAAQRHLRNTVKATPGVSRVADSVYKQCGHIDAAVRRARASRA